MKKIPLLVMAFILSLGLSATFFREKAYAEPICYSTSGDSSDGNSGGGQAIGQTTCSSVYENLAQRDLGHGLMDGFCYVAGLTIEEYPINSGECEWLAILAAVEDHDDNQDNNNDLQGNLNQERDEIVNCNPNDGSDCLNDNPIVSMLKIFVNFLSALVGIIVIAVIVMAGIQYSAAGDNPNATGTAKKRILNAIIALVAYMFLYAIFQWLIPGGVL